MSRKDPYEVLGVSRSASADEIKSAYRRLARQHHPDVNENKKESEEKFKEISEAYAVLSDAQKRAQYDRFGTVEENQSGPFNGGFGNFEDLFDVFFGGGGRQQSARQRPFGRDGEDVRYDLTLSLKDVLTGVEESIRYERSEKCEACGGLGTEGGASPETCDTCHGTGAVSRIQSTMLGQIRTTVTCPRCGGTGSIIRHKCKVCKGSGASLKEAEITVKIPAGVEEGATLHLVGHGGQGTGAGRAGDLYVVLHVENDPRFERDGVNLHTYVEISFPQAVLGDHIKIEGLESTLDLQIPAGTQPGKVFQLKGHGLPSLHRHSRGDLFVQIQVTVPEKLTHEQKKLIEQFASTLEEEMPKGEDLTSKIGHFFKKKR